MSERFGLTLAKIPSSLSIKSKDKTPEQLNKEINDSQNSDNLAFADEPNLKLPFRKQS